MNSITESYLFKKIKADLFWKRLEFAALVIVNLFIVAIIAGMAVLVVWLLNAMMNG